MTSDNAYQIWLFAIDKNLQQGYGSPADFNLTIGQAQRGYTDYLKGEYQKYQAGRPIAPVSFGQNEMIRQSLAPLIYGAILPINPANGISPFPSDFEYNDAMWGLYGYYNIRFIQQDRLASYLSDPIDPVAENPVYLIQQEGFHFFPETMGSAKMSYIRTPPPITWGYDLDGNGLPIYNAAKSQQPVWADTDMLEIIVRALALVGVNLQFNTVLAYASDIKKDGQ